jgi:hypothetical protein
MSQIPKKTNEKIKELLLNVCMSVFFYSTFALNVVEVVGLQILSIHGYVYLFSMKVNLVNNIHTNNIFNYVWNITTQTLAKGKFLTF